ncbi:hypothetical protein CEXT_270791 [Caerostris extrusa]|uniref:Uncharacterized protein n=1 Tax=Caerostris extrusa TaxID=172846 RepID=A0AAV4VU38_CAEEX|nr:hypothetical protein CEXT_270791 [Caerostris extrusa]
MCLPESTWPLTTCRVTSNRHGLRRGCDWRAVIQRFAEARKYLSLVLKFQLSVYLIAITNGCGINIGLPIPIGGRCTPWISLA